MKGNDKNSIDLQNVKGFQNRRLSSNLLRNVYPGGYKLPQRNFSLTSEGTLESLESIGAFLPSDSNGKLSFMNWTRGNNDESSIADVEDNMDPFADVAGQYYRSNSNSHLASYPQFPKIDDNKNIISLSSLSSKEMKLSRRDFKNKSKALQILPINNSLAAVQESSIINNNLPNLDTHLYARPSGTGIHDDIHAAYAKITKPQNPTPNFVEHLRLEDWSHTREYSDQSQGQNYFHPHESHYSDASISHIANSSLNTSSYPGSSYEYFALHPPNNITPDDLHLQFFSSKLIMQSVNPNDMQDCFNLVVKRNFDFKSFLKAVVQRMQNTGEISQDSSRKLIPSLHYYNSALTSWRKINTEAEWNEAKVFTLDRNENLKIMYSLGRYSEISSTPLIPPPPKPIIPFLTSSNSSTGGSSTCSEDNLDMISLHPQSLSPPPPSTASNSKLFSKSFSQSSTIAGAGRSSSCSTLNIMNIGSPYLSPPRPRGSSNQDNNNSFKPLKLTKRTTVPKFSTDFILSKERQEILAERLRDRLVLTKY